MIIKKKIKAKSETVWTVKIDDYQEECHSKERAQSLLKELKEKKESRLKDFLIAEKLFEWHWINDYNRNYLISSYERKNSYFREDQIGKKEGLYFDSVFTLSRSDKGWNVPEYNRVEQFTSLLAAVTKLGFYVEFWSTESAAGCFIKHDFTTEAYSRFEKPKDYWSIECCLAHALKEAAYNLALKIE